MSKTIEINPPVEPIGTIIWLHGLGASGDDFIPIIPQLALPLNTPLRFIFPEAPLRPVTINNGYVMRAWHDIVSLSIDQRADEAGLFASVNTIEALIQKEEARGIPPSKIILAGFSQGAAVALVTALTHAKKLAGVICLSGYLPFPEKVFSKATIANQTTSIFVGHGTEDTVVPLFLAKMVHDALEKHHYSVNWHTYPMPHTVCEKEVGDIAEWIKKIF